MSARPNKVLSKATAVIDLLAREGALTPAQIASYTGIARSSAYRLVDTLVDARLAEQLTGSRVRLTRRWLQLADAAVAGLSEWAGTQRGLETLARETGLTAYLTVPENGEATCIAWAQGSGIDLLELRPGRSLPLNAGAAGRCFLAFDAKLTEATLTAEELPMFTDHTLIDRSALLSDIEVTRERGYALSDEDVTLGVGAIGIPLFRDEQLAGCISLAGLAEVVRRDQAALAEQLLRTVRDLIR